MSGMSNLTGSFTATSTHRSDPAGPDLDQRIQAATSALLDRQQPDGHWVFELEADATIPAEYVLFTHFLGEPVDTGLEGKIAAYLRRIQAAAWRMATVSRRQVRHERQRESLFRTQDGRRFSRRPIICGAPARQFSAHGGAASSNVFTRILLALFGALPWRCVPVMPVEIMLLPSWFPFHLSKISYWARTIIVPLLILQAFKPVARNPRGTRIDEIFVASATPAARYVQGAAPEVGSGSPCSGPSMPSCASLEPLMPSMLRRRAIEAAVSFIKGAAQRRGRALVRSSRRWPTR